MKLLNTGNAKTKKGQKKGYITFGMHLAPSNLSGFNVCPSASNGCAKACLNTAGRGKMTSVQKARIAKTLFFFKDRKGFLAQLNKEIQWALKHAAKRGMLPCFRLNLTSDIPWERHIDIEAIDAPFYDYTKIYKRVLNHANGLLPKNYHLTFSRSENKANQKQCLEALDMGQNVAVVFRNSLPKRWEGYTVINGDETDLRFLDGSTKVVGLVEKGDAKKDKTGFVVTP